MSDQQAVVVTTQHRGVFFGYARGDLAQKTLILERCRMCVHWSADVRGILGLAAGGPTRGCRVTRPVKAILHDVTAVLEASPEAAKAWEVQPWA